ncbi:MAG: magnetic particle specific iron-binding protein [Magnetococcales bacterium]|nr:magnetic particle specific iron-binding protein [Magnetococcales bacterium]
MAQPNMMTPPGLDPTALKGMVLQEAEFNFAAKGAAGAKAGMAGAGAKGGMAAKGATMQAVAMKGTAAGAAGAGTAAATTGTGAGGAAAQGAGTAKAVAGKTIWNGGASLGLGLGLGAWGPVILVGTIAAIGVGVYTYMKRPRGDVEMEAAVS